MDSSFWNNKRASGIDDSIDLAAYGCLGDVLKEMSVSFADKIAFTSMGYSLTYREVDELSDAFAGFLQHRTTLKAGDRVAVQLINTIQTPIVVYGILKAGFVLVNINPLYTAREMEEQFIDSNARALVFMDMFGDKVEAVLSKTSLEYLIVTGLSDLLPQPKRVLISLFLRYIKKAIKPFNLPQLIPLNTVLKAGKRYPVKSVSVCHEDIAVLQYTGGTTGRAKGAMLTHRNLIANMLQSRAALKQTDKNGNPLFLSGEETVIVALPLYHIYAFTLHLMVFPGLGVTNVLVTDPRDRESFIRLLKSRPFSGFVGLNTLFASLLSHPDFSGCNFKSLKLTLSGGTALSEGVAQQWKEVTGCPISEGYGLTECSPVVCFNPMGELSRLGTVGVPLPGTSLRVIDTETQKEVAPGCSGELCIKGPQVMRGYWKNVKATEGILSHDGWLHTGDIAQITQEGFIRIIDRIKDMILVSGFNVYPNEIESIVMRHCDVVHCAVIGIPDSKTGEAVKLFVVPANAELTKGQLELYCREYLAGYKVPRHIEFCRQLPMTPVGKVLRRVLREGHQVE